MTHIRFKVTKNAQSGEYSAYSKAYRSFTRAESKYKLWQKLKAEYEINKHFKRKGVWIAFMDDGTAKKE